MDKILSHSQIELIPFTVLDKVTEYGDVYFSDNDAIVVAPASIMYASTHVRLAQNMTYSITIYNLHTQGEAFYRSAQQFGGNIVANVGQIKILTIYDTLLVLLAFHSEEKEFDGYASAFPEEYTTVYFYNLSTKSVEHSCRLTNYNIMQSNIVRHKDIVYLHNCVDVRDNNYDGCFHMVNLKTKKCNNIRGTFNFSLQSMYASNNALILNVDETLSPYAKRQLDRSRMKLVIDILHPNVSKYGIITFNVKTMPFSQRIKFQNPHIKTIYVKSYIFIYNRKSHRWVACFNHVINRGTCACHCGSPKCYNCIDVVDVYCPHESVGKIIVKLRHNERKEKRIFYEYMYLTHQPDIHAMCSAYMFAKRIKNELAEFIP